MGSNNNNFKKKGFNKGFKPFPPSDKKSFAEFRAPPKNANMKDISILDKGDSFTLTGSIDRVIQTGGPTVFYVNDGTATLALKAFEGAGVGPLTGPEDAVELRRSAGEGVERTRIVSGPADGRHNQVQKVAHRIIFSFDLSWRARRC